MTPDISDLDIIYICSHGRSGSTLVGSVLGLVDGYCYVGEVGDVWIDGLADNHACGCGKPFRECPFWAAVFAAAFGGFDTPETKRAAKLFTEMYRPPATFELFRLVWRHREAGRNVDVYTSLLGRLYRAIAEVSGCRTIIDSSKSLRYAALLLRIPGVKLRLVNVIRDPRGIVHSRTRRARFRDGTDKPEYDESGGYRVFRIISKWVMRNWLGRRWARDFGGARVLYEDFVRDQRPLVTAIAGGAQADKVLAMLAVGIPESIIQHQIAGNWVRGLRISTKEAWRTELPHSIAAITGFLSWPWRRSYRFEAFDRQTILR